NVPISNLPVAVRLVPIPRWSQTGPSGNASVLVDLDVADEEVYADFGTARTASTSVTVETNSTLVFAGHTFDDFKLAEISLDTAPAIGTSYAAVVHWGDGTSSTATVVEQSSVSYDVLIDHTFAHAGV